MLNLNENSNEYSCPHFPQEDAKQNNLNNKKGSLNLFLLPNIF